MIEFVFPFAVMLFGVVFSTMLFGWIASRFVGEEKAKIAAFSFVLGGLFFGNRFGAVDTVADAAYVASLVVGLAFVGLQFFWRGRAHA